MERPAGSVGLAAKGRGMNKLRGRKIGVLAEPAVGLAGWKFAAPQPVILKERSPLPRMKDLNWRSPLIPPTFTPQLYSVSPW
jgi:hypothetical protein